MRVKRASKYGFCAGVRIADLKARRFAADGGRGAILGALVHNQRVVRELEDLGLKSVDSIDSAVMPTVVFSAHGVPPSASSRAETSPGSSAERRTSPYTSSSSSGTPSPETADTTRTLSRSRRR